MADLLLLIPLMIWLSLNSESEGWPQRGSMGRMELSGRRRLGWDAREMRRAGRRPRRW